MKFGQTTPQSILQSEFHVTILKFFAATPLNAFHKLEPFAWGKPKNEFPRVPARYTLPGTDMTFLYAKLLCYLHFNTAVTDSPKKYPYSHDGPLVASSREILLAVLRALEHLILTANDSTPMPSNLVRHHEYPPQALADSLKVDTEHSPPCLFQYVKVCYTVSITCINIFKHTGGTDQCQAVYEILVNTILPAYRKIGTTWPLALLYMSTLQNALNTYPQF